MKPIVIWDYKNPVAFRRACRSAIYNYLERYETKFENGEPIEFPSQIIIYLMSGSKYSAFNLILSDVDLFGTITYAPAIRSSHIFFNVYSHSEMRRDYVYCNSSISVTCSDLWSVADMITEYYIRDWYNTVSGQNVFNIDRLDTYVSYDGSLINYSELDAYLLKAKESDNIKLDKRNEPAVIKISDKSILRYLSSVIPGHEIPELIYERYQFLFNQPSYNSEEIESLIAAMDSADVFADVAAL